MRRLYQGLVHFHPHSDNQVDAASLPPPDTAVGVAADAANDDDIVLRLPPACATISASRPDLLATCTVTISDDNTILRSVQATTLTTTPHCFVQKYGCVAAHECTLTGTARTRHHLHQHSVQERTHWARWSGPSGQPARPESLAHRIACDIRP